ncbi:MAG: hypothetical protein JW818_09200 [Pirellulales bacterium]|nr:hypothetical protein [Pirellulales bacterium]
MRNPLLFVALGALVALSASVANAQMMMQYAGPPADASFDANVARIAYLEEKVASLENCYQSQPTADACCGSGCGTLSCCQGQAGLIGGYDFLWLQPTFSEATPYMVHRVIGGNDFWAAGRYPTEFNTAPRLWLGYQGCTGAGARVRYWQYDHAVMNGHLTSDATTTYLYSGITVAGGNELRFNSGMEMHVIDLEAFQDWNRGCWRGTLGGGVRYGKVQFDNFATLLNGAVVTQAQREWHCLEAVGPTAFVDFQRPIRNSKFSLVGGLRGSVLFGRAPAEEYSVSGPDPITITAWTEDAHRTSAVLEANIGLQYDVSLRCGVDVFARCTWEGQFWHGVGSPGEYTSDMGLQGLAISVGIAR